MSDACQSYRALVSARKACRRCAPELVNPADVETLRARHGQLCGSDIPAPKIEEFDGPEIGPWSLWLGSCPTRLLVVGQDWGTDGYYLAMGGRDVPGNETNKRLIEFIAQLGLSVPPPGTSNRNAGVLLTNAILCLKPGTQTEMSKQVRMRWFDNCGQFLRQTVAVSAAQVVVCLGAKAHAAIARAYGFKPLGFRQAVESLAAYPLPGGVPAFTVFHPAARAKDRSFDQQRADWQRLSVELATRGIDLRAPSP